ncbi:MAG: hypothetical protein ABFS10_01470, partial [Bacteroidota bacterium]
VTNLNAAASSIRWHPSGDWIFFISAGELYMARVKSGAGFGKTTRLSDGMPEREQLVVSPDGNQLAYTVRVPMENSNGTIVKDASGKDFRQIFVMDLEMDKLHR